MPKVRLRWAAVIAMAAGFLGLAGAGPGGAVRNGARLRRHLPGGTRPGRCGRVPRRPGQWSLPTLSANVKGVATQIDLPRGASGDNNALQTGLNGRMPLFNRANQAAMEQAQRSLVASRAELESAEQDLIIRLTQAYFDVLSAKDDVALAKTNKVAILEQLASAKRNFEVGTATITDTREASVPRRREPAHRAGLSGGAARRRPPPLVTPVVLPTIMPATVEEWATVAGTVHPQVTRARRALGRQAGDRRPRPASCRPSMPWPRWAELRHRRLDHPGTTRTASIGVEPNWPLYTGGPVQNRIKTVSKEQLARGVENAPHRGAEHARRPLRRAVRRGWPGAGSRQSSSRLSLEATRWATAACASTSTC